MATILQILDADRNLSLFYRGLKIADLENKLKETGPFTILVPVNLAVGRMTSISYNQMLEPSNRNELLDFLSGYIISGKVMIREFRNDQKMVALNGKQIWITMKNGETFTNGAKILSKDRQGSNGVIHLLDKIYAVAQN